MKTLPAISLLIVFAQSAFAEENILNDYFEGSYLLVGKGVDTDHTYTGKVEIFRDKGSLKLKRTVNGTAIVGSAAIEAALGGDARVLRFRYVEAGKAFEQTCLWSNDLDNYPRISCYLYEAGGKTMNPGLEVLFHDHTAE